MINVFHPKFRTDEIVQQIRECLDKGWTGMGFKTTEFEEAWKRYTFLPHAHFLNSATAGLHLAVHMLKKQNRWKDGDEIITTPITFVSTNHAILYERMKPVFADVDKYLCIDPDDMLSKITRKTRAVMYVGMGGNSGQFARIVEICRAKKLKLILDAAHMAGTRYLGSHAGHGADVSVFSFQAVKNLPTSDGGMICWMDEDMDSWARKLSWLGASKDTYQRSEGSYKWQYDVPDVGFKYHGNSITAAIALVQLRYLDMDNYCRNQLAEMYIENINLPYIPVVEGCFSSRHLFQVVVDDRDRVMQHMNDNGIYPGVHYRSNLNYPMFEGNCPNADDISSKIISLPLHLNLSEDDVMEVCKQLRYANRRVTEFTAS